MDFKQLKFIDDNFETMTRKELAVSLKVGVKDVTAAVRELGIAVRNTKKRQAYVNDRKAYELKCLYASKKQMCENHQCTMDFTEQEFIEHFFRDFKIGYSVTRIDIYGEYRLDNMIVCDRYTIRSVGKVFGGHMQFGEDGTCPTIEDYNT